MIRPIIEKTTNAAFWAFVVTLVYPLHDGAALRFQPFSGSIVVGAICRNPRPKAGRVVHLAAVAQLMDHHIVPHPLGAKHEETVEVQIPLT